MENSGMGINPVDTFEVTLKFQVREINTLLTALNLPSQAPTVTLYALISAIQNQSTPQVDAFEASLATSSVATA